jgi:hypothetical protein
LRLLTAEAIYSLNFPWMDPSEHMSKNPMAAMGRAGILGLFQLRDPSTARRAVDIVSIFRGRLSMADGWFLSLARLYKFYMRTKRKLRSHYKITDPFSQTEVFKGPATLLPLRMAKEDYKTLDAAFGVAAAEDVYMVDAPPAEAEKPADPVGQLERWNATNAGPNGLTSPYHRPPSSSSSLTPVATAAVQALGAAAAAAAAGASPSPVSPALPQYAPAGAEHRYNPAGPDLAAAAAQHQQQQQREQQAPPQQWSAEQVQAWVDALETKFTAADVAAFVEGRECRSTTGWLGLIWE